MIAQRRRLGGLDLGARFGGALIASPTSPTARSNCARFTSLVPFSPGRMSSKPSATSEATRFAMAIVGETFMAKPSDKEIAAGAYKLWEQKGQPEGRDEEFWRLAEQELLNEDKSSPLRTPDTL
jgi:Protein of unknown function (DUF2934)